MSARYGEVRAHVVLPGTWHTAFQMSFELARLEIGSIADRPRRHEPGLQLRLSAFYPDLAA